MSLSLKSLFLKKDIPAKEIPIEELDEEELRIKYERDFSMRLGPVKMTKENLLDAYKAADRARGESE